MYTKELYVIQYTTLPEDGILTEDDEHYLEMWVTKDFAIKLIVSLQEAGATDISLLRWDGQWWCRENLS